MSYSDLDTTPFKNMRSSFILKYNLYTFYKNQIFDLLSYDLETKIFLHNLSHKFNIDL